MLFEEITRHKKFRSEVVERISIEKECLRHLSSLQYTITDQHLAVRFTKFIKTHFADILLDRIGEALFEFEFDLCSASSVEVYLDAVNQKYSARQLDLGSNSS